MATKQRSWNQTTVEKTQSSLLSSQTTQYHRARLHATSAPHSGDWLHALSISSCSLRLDDEVLRIAVGPPLASKLCDPHDCMCGSLVDYRGLHGLFYRRSSGMSTRHSYLNDPIFHALSRTGISSIKEPDCLLRSDGKRPNGLALTPRQAEKNAIWNVTVTDNLAMLFINSTSVTAGSAAEQTTARKEKKYAALALSHTFIPIAIKTMWTLCFFALGIKVLLNARVAN